MSQRLGASKNIGMKDYTEYSLKGSCFSEKDTVDGRTKNNSRGFKHIKHLNGNDT